MNTLTQSTTVASVLGRLAACIPHVEGTELTLDLDPPADLNPVLRVLHTGCRALLAGKPWYGLTGADGHPPRFYTLDPKRPIPLRVAILCVAGDTEWDRIPPWSRIDNPELFEQPKPAKGAV
jgi:hypothetical protein